MASSGPPPLTYSNVREIVLRVPGRKRKGFYMFLNIPSLRERGKSDGDEMKAHIDWYLQSYPHPSWRGIITALDGTEQTTIADSIREWAEPIKDNSLREDNVKSVWGAVLDVMSVGRSVGVPSAVRQRIESTHYSPFDKGQAVGTYWLKTLPDVSWEQLARHLYFFEEEEALQKVIPYVKKPKDPTLTEENVHAVVKGGVKNWWWIGDLLNVPISKRQELKIKYDGEEDQLCGLMSTYLSDHPCPSWQQLATALQHKDWGDATAAEAVAMFVKGTGGGQSAVPGSTKAALSAQESATLPTCKSDT